MKFQLMGNVCQSCGMPLAKDVNHGGTNADGSKSLEYCSLCFENGQFKQPNMTATEMQALAKDKLKEMGFPGLMAGFFTRGIPKLKRWAQTS